MLGSETFGRAKRRPVNATIYILVGYLWNFKILFLNNSCRVFFDFIFQEWWRHQWLLTMRYLKSYQWQWRHHRKWSEPKSFHWFLGFRTYWILNRLTGFASLGRTFLTLIYVGKGCSRRNVLTTIKCWWRLLPSIFEHKPQAPTFKKYHQHRNSVAIINRHQL